MQKINFICLHLEKRKKRNLSWGNPTEKRRILVDFSLFCARLGLIDAHKITLAISIPGRICFYEFKANIQLSAFKKLF